MMNKLHPLSFVRKWVFSIGIVLTAFMAAGVCARIAITIEFDKQSGIVCLPGRGMCWNCK